MKHLISITTLLSMTALPLLLFSDAHAADQEVRLLPGATTLEIQINGEPFATYHFAGDLPKPYLAPVRVPGGGPVITRSLDPEQIKDHPHHKGIWVSVDEINDVDFWAEKGKIENVSVTPLQPAGNPTSFVVINEWKNDAGSVVVTETTRISIFANGLLSYDISLSAGDEIVRFGDTKEGFFGFRMVDSMREKVGGRVVNAGGVTGTAECWGRPSPWIDYSGTVGDKTVGLAIFDHPLNPRPSRYHVRDYGLFSISPFGEHAYSKKTRPAEEIILPPGAAIRFRYAMFIHSGDTAQAAVPDMYLQYLRAVSTSGATSGAGSR